MCQPIVLWHNCNHLTYTIVDCPAKAAIPPDHFSHEPTVNVTDMPCFLCIQPESEPLNDMKRNQLTAKQLEGILDADMTAPGFRELVARFYARGGHTRFGQPDPTDAGGAGPSAEDRAFDEMDKRIRTLHALYGTALMPLPPRIADMMPGYAFDFALEELATTPSDPTVINLNGLPNVGIGFWGDDHLSDRGWFGMSSNSPPPGNLPAPPSVAFAEDQHSLPVLASPYPISAPGDPQCSLPEPMLGGNGAPDTAVDWEQYSSMQMAPASMAAQDGYPVPAVLAPSPLPAQGLCNNHGSPPQLMGPPATQSQAQPATPTAAGKKRSSSANSTPHQVEPGTKVTFDTKRFKTPTKPKSAAKPKKSIRVITDPSLENSPPAPPPASTSTTASASAPTPASTPTSAPGHQLQNDEIQDMMLQCHKVRQAAERRREEEMKERSGQNGVLGVQGQDLRVQK
ncbi:hypothetical protein PHISP_00153 [Aspergillus sp. HF37]|nr:hypothetical protein PHISP_00153 [Aspergillus sp. HF37]